MTHNDFTAAKLRAPVAVYCGSVPKMKPGYVSLRNGVDSNLQLYGNRWGGADPAALQSSLSLQMKRSYLWGGENREFQPEIPPLKLEGISEANIEPEVDNAAQETARLKDKLKRKMSESSSARGAPSEPINLMTAPLKPAVPRSASQRLLTVTKPVPPIQRSPTPRPSTPEEGRNGPDYMDHMEEHHESTSALKEISFSVSKSAQDKLRQKQQEIENIRNEKKRSQQQLWERLQGVEAAGQEPVSVTTFSLTGLSALPVSSDKWRGAPNISLSKWVSRPSLPSLPTVNPEPAVSDFRHSSAYSLPASFLDLSEWDSDSENGGPGSGPMSHPEQGMLEALKWLNHKDWEQKEKGLLSVRCLASWHPEVLCSRIHDVSLAVTREVSNLRSKVSRHAIKTIGDLFKCLRRNLDQEVEEIVRVLLHKIGDSNDFIRDEADKSLGVMVDSVSPSKAMSALIAGGVSHRNSSVRKCMAKHLYGVVELLGSEKLLCGSREGADTFLRTLIKLIQDGQQDTRFYGRRMFSLIMSHPKFEAHMERLVPSHELRDLIATVKQKELSDSMAEVPSGRSHRASQKNSAVVRTQESQESAQSINRSASEESEPQGTPVPRRQPVRAAEMTEQLKELNKLLTAKEYQNKMDGVTLLLEHCKNNTKFVTTNITQIFDAFNPRLQDANKKVNQYALESAVVMIPILRDSLHHVLVPLVTVITDNLNSKHSGIYTAAVTTLNTLISNIDNLWLLQPFASRIRFLSGRAMSDVTERLSGLVSSVYPRKPQAVERHVLPVLWFFLSNITGNGVLPGRNGNFKDVVTKLTKTLHRAMGSSLEEYASGQSQHAIKMLADILGT
ncbi:TOG array regulator of axonemal microtubules protein 2 [Gastrophryne carolinensis]